jgi:hypothetical protein
MNSIWPFISSPQFGLGRRFFELENPMKAPIVTKNRGRRSRAAAAASA